MSEWIRSKDADQFGITECYTCYRKFPWKELDCGHRYHDKLDFDQDNLKPQCTYCNRYLHGNLGEYEQHLIRDYGLEWSKLLKVMANTNLGYSVSDLKAITDDLKSKLTNISTLNK